MSLVLQPPVVWLLILRTGPDSSASRAAKKEQVSDSVEDISFLLSAQESEAWGQSMMLYLGSTATAGQVQVLENPIRENIVPVLNLFSFRCWL